MIIMPRTNQVIENEKTKQLQEELIAEKQRLRKEKKMQEARDTLTNYESEYDHAKEVFFSVNGARRVLKQD